MNGLQWFGLILGALLVAAAGLVAYGAWRWTVDTRLLMYRLDAGRHSK